MFLYCQNVNTMRLHDKIAWFLLYHNKNWMHSLWSPSELAARSSQLSQSQTGPVGSQSSHPGRPHPDQLPAPQVFYQRYGRPSQNTRRPYQLQPLRPQALHQLRPPLRAQVWEPQIQPQPASQRHTVQTQCEQQPETSNLAPAPGHRQRGGHIHTYRGQQAEVSAQQHQRPSQSRSRQVRWWKNISQSWIYSFCLLNDTLLSVF